MSVKLLITDEKIEHTEVVSKLYKENFASFGLIGIPNSSQILRNVDAVF